MSSVEIGKQHYLASHLFLPLRFLADISDIITRTLENHYSVLLPCDPSPRLLELLVLLDQHWSYKITDNQQARAQGREQWIYPLCLVSRTAADMVSFARSFIEWTGGVVRDAAAGLDEELTKKRRRNVTGDSYGALDFK
jgi:cleavage and polyadenylation specificity factor subunit 2